MQPKEATLSGSLFFADIAKVCTKKCIFLENLHFWGANYPFSLYDLAMCGKRFTFAE